MKRHILLWSFILSSRLAWADDIKDIKGPLKYPEHFLFWILLAVTILMVGFLAYFIYKKFKSHAAKIKVKIKSPYQVAQEKLLQLERSHLLEKGQFKQYYDELSDIVRAYIEEQLHIRAPEMTTEEFLYSLNSATVFTAQQKMFFKEFLNNCDLVKFAKWIPHISDAKNLYASAQKLIEEIQASYGPREPSAQGK